MERVAFLVEETGDRIACLLNPSSVIVRRTAGVRQRSSLSGPLTGAGLSHDPLIYTGGGSTEILLDLLFDTSLVSAPETAENVMDLTRPLTELAEGKRGENGYGQVPLVRFIWGKAWNILGVIAAVAERLENFSPQGAPQRSWLRMRLLRVTDKSASESNDVEAFTEPDLPDADDVYPEDLGFHEMLGTGDGLAGDKQSERLDQVASAHYGDPAWWRSIAAFNNIDDPWQIQPGHVLMLPPADGSSGGEA